MLVSDCCNEALMYESQICSSCGEHADSVHDECLECEAELTEPNKQRYGYCSSACLEASER